MLDSASKSIAIEEMAGKHRSAIPHGYYGWKDGLDRIWLVNEEGKYEQTIDHDFLQKYFEIETVSKERSLYGRNRPQFEPMK